MESIEECAKMEIEAFEEKSIEECAEMLHYDDSISDTLDSDKLSFLHYERLHYDDSIPLHYDDSIPLHYDDSIPLHYDDSIPLHYDDSIPLHYDDSIPLHYDDSIPVPNPFNNWRHGHSILDPNVFSNWSRQDHILDPNVFWNWRRQDYVRAIPWPNRDWNRENITRSNRSTIPTQLFFDSTTTLLVTVCGTKSGRDSRPQTSRLDVYVGDKRLLDPNFRKFYGIIEEIISVQKITVRSDLADETRSKMFVSLELVGPEKDNWQHCMNKDGATLLPKRQRLYIDQLLRQLDATGECDPQAAHWLFETSVDCPPLTCLQAQLEFQQLTSGATPPTAADKCSSDGEGVIRLRVKVADAPSRCCGLQG